MSADVLSKVLVHESDANAEHILKRFFVDKGLVGLRDINADLLHLLEKSIDLGAVFLSEKSVVNDRESYALVQEIHQKRPELPIFLRRDEFEVSSLPDEVIRSISCTYTLGDMTALSAAIDKHLFCAIYPLPLIRGIQELSNNAFEASIKSISCSSDAPYLVKDQIIFGELFSLIPLESAWCRGFMMLQTTEHEILQTIMAGKTNLSAQGAGFRDVNSLMSEITNLIWGGIKTRFFQQDFDGGGQVRTQVPIMVNHKERFISFGTQEPQLCFRYILSDKNRALRDVVVFQKFIFNLSWRPEMFVESGQAVSEMVDAGELEFF